MDNANYFESIYFDLALFDHFENFNLILNFKRCRSIDGSDMVWTNIKKCLFEDIPFEVSISPNAILKVLNEFNWKLLNRKKRVGLECRNFYCQINKGQRSEEGNRLYWNRYGIFIIIRNNNNSNGLLLLLLWPDLHEFAHTHAHVPHRET